MIKIEIPNLLEVQLRLGKVYEKAQPVLVRAINRTADNAKTNMARQAVKRYVIKSSDVKSAINFRKATKNRLYTTVKSNGFKIPMYKFKLNNYAPNQKMPKKERKAYKVKMIKSGGLKKILNGFVTKVNGELGVYKRVGKGKDRLKIRQMFGPAIPQMIGSKECWTVIESEANLTLKKRLDHEIKRMLKE